MTFRSQLIITSLFTKNQYKFDSMSFGKKTKNKWEFLMNQYFMNLLFS